MVLIIPDDMPLCCKLCAYTVQLKLCSPDILYIRIYLIYQKIIFFRNKLFKIMRVYFQDMIQNIYSLYWSTIQKSIGVA